MANKGFVFYESFYNAIQLLSKEEQLAAFHAVVRYGLFDEEPEGNRTLQVIMALATPVIDSYKKKAEGGKKGGRRAKENEGKTIGLPIDEEGLTFPIKENGERKTENGEEYEVEESTSTTSAKALTAKQAQQMVDDTDLPPAADQAIRDWLEYKKERRQGYKTTGLKTLLTIAKRNADLYGGDAIAELIQSSIAAQYQGITWDKLKALPERRTRFNDMEML